MALTYQDSIKDLNLHMFSDSPNDARVCEREILFGVLVLAKSRCKSKKRWS